MTDATLQRFNAYAVDGGCDAYGQMEEDDHGDYYNREDVDAKLAEHAAEIERLRSLLGRYADHVGDEEGSDFLQRVGEGSPITKAEAEEISFLCPSNAALAVKP